MASSVEDRVRNFDAGHHQAVTGHTRDSHNDRFLPAAMVAVPLRF